MAVKLVSVTVDNYTEVIKLCVSPKQEKFVGTTAEAIADAHFHPSYVMFAVQANGIIVGFLMYDPALEKVMLRRFLIDCKHQKKGYGRAALELWKQHAREQYPLSFVLQLHTKTENSDAISLYEKAGFAFEPLPGYPDVMKGILFLQ